MTALELDHHLPAAETVAGKRTPGGSVGQICDKIRLIRAEVLWRNNDSRRAYS
jgi:hypothetical protein